MRFIQFHYQHPTDKGLTLCRLIDTSDRLLHMRSFGLHVDLQDSADKWNHWTPNLSSEVCASCLERKPLALLANLDL